MQSYPSVPDSRSSDSGDEGPFRVPPLETRASDPGKAKPQTGADGEGIWQWVWRLGGILFAVAVSVGVYLFRNRLQDAASYGYVGLFVISMLGNATLVLPVPTFVTAFVGGGVYNPILVGVISAAGATLGELTGYLAGRSGKTLVEKRDLYERFSRWMDRYGLFALFALAAVPNPFFDLAGIVAGMAHMKVTTYLLVVWAGKIVKFILIAYLGAGSVNLFQNLLGS